MSIWNEPSSERVGMNLQEKQVSFEPILTEEIKNKLSEFEPADSLLIYDSRTVAYYRIPGIEKNAAIAVICNFYCEEVEATIKDGEDQLWTVVAVCYNYKEKKYYPDGTTLWIEPSIEHIVMNGPYACYGYKFSVDGNNPFYKSCDGALYSKKYSNELLSYITREIDYEKFRDIRSIGYLRMSSEKAQDCVTIPSSVESIGSAHFCCKTLCFEGSLPELGDFSDVKAEKIYVNQPFKDIPEERFEKISSIRYGERDIYRAEIITKKPVLSTDVPATPGFIGLTRVDNDEYEFINPRYIIKMKPVSFEKYDGKETGTRILYAAHGSQRAITVDYYEKLLDIDVKIKDAQEALAKSIGGLAGLLEKVNDLYELSQKERF